MIIDKLKDEFDKRSKKNKAYSLRAFAKSLDIHSSTLSALLSGKRNLTHKTAVKLLSAIKLSNIEKQHLLFSGLENSNVNQSSVILREAQLEIIPTGNITPFYHLLNQKIFSTQ